jgi:immune inhibitor A
LCATLTLLATLTVALPAASRPAIAEARSIQDLAMFRAAKFDAHLRVPHTAQIERLLREEMVLVPGDGPRRVEAAVQEFMREWIRRNPTTPNPEKFRQLLRNERLAAANEALRLTTAADESDDTPQIRTLVAPVEFAGPDTFTYSAEDPVTGECYEQEVSTDGPLHNEIPPPGPRDNNTVWYEDATPELYDELYFGVGPDAGVIIDHPNLGDVDLRGNTVANYYLEQSEGAFKPEGDVYPGWLRAAHSEGWYGADSCETGSHHVRARDLVRELADLIKADDPDFPWQDYDGDGDGRVDNFTVIHAGMGQEAGGGPQGDFSIWSHAASIDWPTGYLACTAGSPGCPDRDIYVLDYSMDPENYDVGVGAEEFGHAAFGLPDIYTTDYQLSVANWAIMEAGAWNGPLGGMQPAPFPGWFRYVVGWWDPVELDYTTDPTLVVVGQHSLRPKWTEQGIRINLPDAVRYLGDPYSGEYMWWGNAGDLMDNAVRRTVDLTGKTTASLGFWTFYEIEEGWDFGFVQVSTDGGAKWTSLENPDTTYDHDPGAIETVLANLPGFTGHSEGWAYEEFDLTDYAGQEIMLQFRYVTDWANTERGWFIDDITITADDEPIFFDDVEAGPGDWTADPEDGWMITTGTLVGTQYYLVE